MNQQVKVKLIDATKSTQVESLNLDFTFPIEKMEEFIKLSIKDDKISSREESEEEIMVMLSFPIKRKRAKHMVTWSK